MVGRSGRRLIAEKIEGADLKFGHYRNAAERPASHSGGKRKAGPTLEGEDARRGGRPLQERGVSSTDDGKRRRADLKDQRYIWEGGEEECWPLWRVAVLRAETATLAPSETLKGAAAG